MRVLSILTCALGVGARAIFGRAPDGGPLTATARQIYRGEPGSWFENLRVRSNGKIIATRLDKASLYEIDPKTGAAQVIYNFTDFTGALGIAEYAPDVFAVVAGIFNVSTLTSTKGSYTIQSFDFNKPPGPDGKLTPTLLTKIPQASFLNGLTFESPSTLYAADSGAFEIFKIDTKSRAISVASPPNKLYDNSTVNYPIPIAINGLKWDAAGKQLLWSNSEQVSVGRTPLRGDKFAPPEKIASGINGTGVFDDFDLDCDSNLYLATTGGHIAYLSRDGKTQAFIKQNNVLSLDGPTSTHFGTGASKDILYIATGGYAANGTSVGGQIIEYKFN